MTKNSWTNWAGNQNCTPARFVKPNSADEAVGAVRTAIKDGLEVRVAGSGHAFSPLVPTDGLLLDLKGLAGVISVDKEKRRARVYAGTQIRDLAEELWSHGLSLSNQGDIDHQVIMGAVSTATHGSGIKLGSFSSTVRGMKIINGHGEHVEVTENDREELLAAATSLGTLGVITEVELEVVPAFDLQEEITFEDWEETRANWEKEIAENRHFSFFWSQTDESPHMYGLDVDPGEPFTNRTYVKRYREELKPDSTKHSRVRHRQRDRAYKIFPDIDPDSMPNFHEVEYFVPNDRGLEALEAAQRLILDDFPHEHFPIEVRFVAPDKPYLSPMFGRESTVLSVSGKPGTNYEPYLRAFDSLMDSFNARPHWGKMHFLDRARVERLYPEFDSFQKVRKAFDPNGTFLNDHTRPLFH